MMNLYDENDFKSQMHSKVLHAKLVSLEEECDKLTEIIKTVP